MPPSVEDRDADVWESLLAIADAAGEGWPKRARAAAVALVAAAADKEPSLGIRLLSDLREIFGEHDQLTTAEILMRLHALPEAPWNDLRGKQLNDRGLAYRLREYGVKSKNLNTGGEHRPKGYARCELHDAWQRYLAPLPAHRSATSATSATSVDFQGKKVADVAGAERSVADDEDEENADKSGMVAEVADVADVARGGDGASTSHLPELPECLRTASTGNGFRPPRGNGWHPAGDKPPQEARARVWLKERWVPGLGPPGDDVFDIDSGWRQ
jgi:uncharacterized protein DUF3631